MTIPSKIIVSICKQLHAFLHAKNQFHHSLLFSYIANSKLVILGNLGMPGHTHLKWWYQFEEIFDVYLKAKNQVHSSRLPWDIARILQICYFGYFGNAWPSPIKNHSTNLWETFMLICMQKKSTLSLTSFLRYCKEIANLLFWVIWACLATHT